MSRLVGTVTQGSNDAYAEAELQTGLQGLGTRAWAVSLIQIEISSVPNVNGAGIEVQLSRSTKAAMATITDRDLIFKHKQSMGLTTSGAILQPNIFTIEPASPIILVEDPLYFAIDSGSTSATNTASISLEVEQVSISELERLSLIADRLSS